MRILGQPLALAFALAYSATAAARPGDEILLLDLCLNARCSGVAAVVVRGEQVLIDREALLAAGLDPTGLPAERVGERDLVDPKGLNAGIAVSVDRAQLRVDLSQRAEDRPVQRVDLRTRPQAERGRMPWSAFVNYAVAVGSGRGEQDAGLESVFVDGAVGRGHAALRSTGFWSDAEGWQRGLTRFEYDDVARLRRWTVGDQFALARDPLGGGALLGGVGVARAFDQDPYLVTFPQPFYSGVLEAPGTVEVYANGALVARRELGAGPFAFESLGLSPGRSDVRVVVRDPFGNRSELAGASYYGSSHLLAAGLSDYAVRLGRLRESSGFGGDGYDDDTALQAWYRRGLTPRLTLGARVEGDRNLRNLGADLALLLPVGEIGLAVAGSEHDADGSGRAASFTYSYAARRFGFGFGARRFDAGYRRLGDTLAFLAPLREDDFATVSFSPNDRLALQLNYGRQRREGQGAERNTGVAATWRLSGRAQLLLSVQRFRSDARDHDDTTALLSFSYAFDRSSIGASARRSDDGSGYGIHARRSRPQDVGWGYDLSLERFEGLDSGFGQVEYQGRHGRYALQAERFGSDSSARLIASGALVAIGGRAFATPPLESGFALVRVPGLVDAPILRENLPVGRTDARGDLLVREMVPFYANKLEIDASDVPVHYDIRDGSRQVAVPRNTGAVVALEADALHAVTGHVRVRGAQGARAAEYGLLRLRRGNVGIETPLGASGRYYLQDLAPGAYEAEVEGDGTVRARCRLQVPQPRAPGVADLGDLVCDANAGGMR